MPAPAPHVDYPQLADLKTQLNDMKMKLPSDATLQGYVDAGIEMFNTAIGAALIAVTDTLVFACRGQPRILIPPCVSLSSVTVLGTAQVAGRDYDLMSVYGKAPWQWIEFSVRLPRSGELANNVYARRGLVMTGLFGLGLNVPATAWLGILALQVLNSVPGIAAAITLGRARLEMGQEVEYFSIRGDGGAYENEVKKLIAIANQAAHAYLRVNVGVST